MILIRTQTRVVASPWLFQNKTHMKRRESKTKRMCQVEIL